jgi:hypothetical protein
MTSCRAQLLLALAVIVACDGRVAAAIMGCRSTFLRPDDRRSIGSQSHAQEDVINRGVEPQGSRARLWSSYVSRAD